MMTRTPNADLPWVTVRELAPTLWPRWIVEQVTYIEDGDCIVHNHVRGADGQPLSGTWVVQVRQGWPNPDLPDEVVDLTTDLNGEADGVVENGFDPGKGQSGPHWFAIRDNKTGAASETAQGFGLPLNRHYSFAVYWRYVVAATPPPTPTPTPGPTPTPTPGSDLEARVEQLEATVAGLAAWQEKMRQANR